MGISQALNIHDLRKLARRRLPRMVYDYLEGGSEDQVTLKANREVFETIRFAPRTLVDVSQRSQKVTLFGTSYDAPFGIARDPPPCPQSSFLDPKLADGVPLASSLSLYSRLRDRD